jgi:acyl-CoA synthetase (AMP-forming)/AMP-acid ligase II
MASFKVPKSVVFVDALPKTAAGKIDKRVLQQKYGDDG